MRRKDYQQPEMTIIRLRYNRLLMSSVNYETNLDGTLPDYGDPTNLLWE